MGVLQYFDKFYENKNTDQTTPKVGDIWWVPTPDVHQTPQILDVNRIDPREHTIIDFKITDITASHFTQRDRLPIKSLNLHETEELLITKAKKRPAIVLAITCINIVNELRNPTQQKLSKHLGVLSYLVAPMYSISTMKNPGTFGPEVVARIRAMHYPHLFCLPDEKDKTQPGSIVRLDRMFPTHLQKGSQRHEKRLAEEPLSVLLSQFAHLTGGVGSEEFELVKELVEESYPID